MAGFARLSTFPFLQPTTAAAKGTTSPALVLEHSPNVATRLTGYSHVLETVSIAVARLMGNLVRVLTSDADSQQETTMDVRITEPDVAHVAKRPLAHFG